MQKDNKIMESFFDDSWTNMHGLLEEHLPQEEKRKKRVFAWWWLGSAVVVVLFGLLIWGGLASNEKIDNIKQIAQAQRSTSTQAQVTETIKMVEEIKEIKNTQPVGAKRKAIQNKSKQKSVQKNINKKQKKVIFSAEKNISNSEKESQFSSKFNSGLKVRKEMELAKNTTPVISISTVLVTQPSLSVELVKSLPIIPYTLLEEKKKNVERKITPRRKNKKFYLDAFAEAGHSFNNYNHGGLGLALGYQFNTRFGLETGFGYKHLLVSAQNGSHSGSQWDDSKSFNYVNKNFLANDWRLDMIEVPLSLHYQLTPKFSIYAGGSYTHQFKTSVEYLSTTTSSMEQDLLIVTTGEIKPHNYFSLQAGANYALGRFKFGLGYRNWSFPSSDHQVFGRVSYRIFR